MRTMRMLIVVFLSVMAITGVVNASASVAADASRGDVVERIGHGGSTYPSKTVRTGDCRSKGDAVERMGHGGSVYQSAAGQAGDCQLAGEMGKRANAVERVGHGGSTYFFSQVMNN